MPGIVIQAPGKIILSGEHSVVYGKPALVTTINRRLGLTANWRNLPQKNLRDWQKDFSQIGAAELLHRLTTLPQLKIEIESEIPIGAGMGSSAALAVALSALIFRLTNQSVESKEINKQAHELEKFAHGTPSGIDNTVITYGGLLHFQRADDGVQHQKIRTSIDIPDFLIIHTGKPKETTAEMVALVRNRREMDSTIQESIENLAVITETIESLFTTKKNHEYLLTAITENERLLEKIGVVSDSAIKLIRKIERLGGAAKISGAGGKKGASGIILAFHPDTSWLKKKIGTAWQTLSATISRTGLTITDFARAELPEKERALARK